MNLRLHNELSTDLSTMAVENTVAAQAAGPVLRVAMDMPRHNLFDYLPPVGLEAGEVPIGARVRVPMGARECIGVVVAHADEPSVSRGALKPIHALIDPDSLLGAPLMRLLRWTAQYYHHSLGEVIAAALPKALRAGAPALPVIELWCAS